MWDLTTALGLRYKTDTGKKTSKTQEKCGKLFIFSNNRRRPIACRTAPNARPVRYQQQPLLNTLYVAMSFFGRSCATKSQQRGVSQPAIACG